MTNKSKFKEKRRRNNYFLLKIIKLHLLLFIIGLGSTISANSLHSQSISVKLNNASIEKLFDVLESNSEFVFLYTNEVKSKKVTAEFDNEKLESILDKTLPTVNLDYRINGKQIVILENEQAVQQGNTIDVSGVVMDSHGEPLIGVSVREKGKTTALAITNIDGVFKLKASPGTILLFSYIGYKEQEAPISKNMQVQMTEDATALDDVVVVAFGRQKKETTTGAITTVSPDLLRGVGSSLSSTFAGRVGGVISVQRSGEPGADGASFWIRGISTFSGTTSPLVFIDGIEVSVGDMNSLPAETIQSFSILKDASATALYGARGANGVILINTRGGKLNEKTRINIRIDGRMAQPTKMVEFADGITYMEAYNEARSTRGKDLRFTQEKIDNTRANLDPYVYPNMDWNDFLFKDWSINQSANLNITGGGNKISYFMNANFKNDDGMINKAQDKNIKNNISQQEYAFMGNIIADVTSTTKVALRMNTIIKERTGSRISADNIYAELFETVPVLFPATFPTPNGADHIYFGNMTGGPHPQHGGLNGYHNVYAEMSSGYNKFHSSTSQVAFDVTQKLDFVTEGLSINGLASFKNYSTTSVTRYFTPTFYQVESSTINSSGGVDYTLSDPLNKGATALSTTTGTSGDRYISLQGSLNYSRIFNNVHDVGAMFVYMQKDYNINNPDNYYATLPLRNQGVAGRLTYSYDTRYMAEVNFGYNGTENFAKGQRWGLFPSFSLGYNLANEAFFEPFSEKVQALKLRGSWGLVGNSANDYTRFPYLTKVTLGQLGWTFGNNWNTTQSGAKIDSYGAGSATWEEGQKLDLGIDISAFKGFDFTFDYFNEDRKNIFMQYETLPIESGVSGAKRPFANLGKVNNRGFEITTQYQKAFLNNELMVSARLTYTYARNKLIDRDEPILVYPYMTNLGKPLNVNTGLVAIGLFKDEDDLKNSPTQTFSDYSVGDIKYADMNDDGKIDKNDMMQIGKSWIPQTTYGFGFNIEYKKFDLGVFFQGVGKTTITMGDIHPFNTQYSQMYKFIADSHWTEENQNFNAAYPRMITEVAFNSHNNQQVSTFWQQTGSFLKLKNVEVGYSYKFARVYFIGDNLLTFSKFKHWDPEIGGMEGSYGATKARGLKYPPLRTLTVGLQLNF